EEDRRRTGDGGAAGGDGAAGSAGAGVPVVAGRARRGRGRHGRCRARRPGAGRWCGHRGALAAVRRGRQPDPAERAGRLAVPGPGAPVPAGCVRVQRTDAAGTAGRVHAGLAGPGHLQRGRAPAYPDGAGRPRRSHDPGPGQRPGRGPGPGEVSRIGAAMTANRTLRATAVTVACVMPVFLVGGLAVQIGGEIGFSPAGLGLAVAVYFAVSALTSVPAGTLVERHGARAGARAGILLSAACLLAIAMAARNFPSLVALLAVGAAANGLGQLAANAMLAGVPADRQGLSFGIKQAAVPTATLLSGLSVPTVALTIGWRWAFAISAVVALATLALVPAAPPRLTRSRAARPQPAPERATGALVVIGISVALAAASGGSERKSVV